ncbi:MAG: hypothetical protein KJO07_09560, partial [Deltaproteobacteria bacterium]|nr:hypothetical protein [Deltaproteobacteria bacterium]
FGPFNPNPVSSLTDGLPVIEGVVITDLASGRPALQWLAEGGARGDLGYFRVEFSSFEFGGAGSWTLVTSDPASGEFRAPQLPPEIQALLTEPSLSVEFDEAAFADFDFADFAQILGTEGFVPDFLASCSNDLRFLEGDSTEGRTRRSVLGGSCSD